jgi:hypothetical protein
MIPAFKLPQAYALDRTATGEVGRMFRKLRVAVSPISY